MSFLRNKFSTKNYELNSILDTFKTRGSKSCIYKLANAYFKDKQTIDAIGQQYLSKLLLAENNIIKLCTEQKFERFGKLIETINNVVDKFVINDITSGLRKLHTLLRYDLIVQMKTSTDINETRNNIIQVFNEQVNKILIPTNKLTMKTITDIPDKDFLENAE